MDSCLLAVSLHGTERQNTLVSLSVFIKEPDLFIRALPLWSHFTFITLYGPQLQIQLHWTLGLQRNQSWGWGVQFNPQNLLPSLPLFSLSLSLSPPFGSSLYDLSYSLAASDNTFLLLDNLFYVYILSFQLDYTLPEEVLQPSGSSQTELGELQ